MNNKYKINNENMQKIQHEINKLEKVAIHQLDIEGDAIESYDVFELPIEFFRFNKYNGRFRAFASQVDNDNALESLTRDEIMTLLKQVGSIDEISKDITARGQFIPIVATKDGIIIDGNRRFTVAIKNNQTHIKAIILKKDWSTIEDLERLETKIQFSMQDKKSYDPLNKSLKIYQIYNAQRKQKNEKNSIEYISEITGEAPTKIRKHISKWDYLNEMVKSFNKTMNYTWFDKAEDQVLRSISFESKTFKSKSLDVKKEWYWNNNEALDKFKAAIFPYILTKVKAVGGVRELLSTKFVQETLVYNEAIFEEWYSKTIEIFDINSDSCELSKESLIKAQSSLTVLMNQTIKKIRSNKITIQKNTKPNFNSNDLSDKNTNRTEKILVNEEQVLLKKQELPSKTKKIHSDPLRTQLLNTIDTMVSSLSETGPLSLEEKEKLELIIKKLKSKS